MQRIPNTASDSVRVVDDVADLSVLFEDAVHIVVLRRAVPGGVQREVAALLAEPDVRLLAAVGPGPSGRDELHARLPEARQLVEDMCFWAEVLCDLTGCDFAGVRLARVESAMCPRFHVDNVAVRVVSALSGGGTEYVGGDSVERRWLGHAAAGADDETSGLLRPGARVERAAQGDVVFLKGEAWSGNAGRGAVHRSPRASPASPRLVMTLDALG